MRLFLPHACTHVTFVPGLTELGRLPEFDYQRWDWNLFDSEEGWQEAVLAPGADATPLRDAPEVISIRPVWVMASDDPIEMPWDQKIRGRQVSCSMGFSILNH